MVRPPKSLGPALAEWAERALVHGPGDVAGDPLRLAPFQLAVLTQAYELMPDGRRRWDAVDVLMPRGNAKTELGAVVAAGELCGPSEWRDGVAARRRSPDIPIAAASWEQADIPFGALRAMVGAGPLGQFVRPYDTAIELIGEAGRAYRIAAVAGTNEGGRPTFSLRDETHEWTGRKRRLATVLDAASRKRAGSWSMSMSTAGVLGEESVAEDAFGHWLAVRAGGDPGRRLVINFAGSAADLDDAAAVREALTVANPAVGLWLDIEQLMAAWADPLMPRHEFRRYHLNEWVRVGSDGWLAEHPRAWGDCQTELDLVDGAEVWAGLDVSLRWDCTALVWVQRVSDRLVARSRVWSPRQGETIDHESVMDAVRGLASRFRLQSVAYDPRLFEVPAAMLSDEGVPMVEVPQSPQRMVPICGRLWEAILSGRVAHDGDTVLTDHVMGAARRESPGGWTLSKSRSHRHIDACIALALALSEAELAGATRQGDPLDQLFA